MQFGEEYNVSRLRWAVFLQFTVDPIVVFAVVVQDTYSIMVRWWSQTIGMIQQYRRAHGKTISRPVASG